MHLQRTARSQEHSPGSKGGKTGRDSSLTLQSWQHLPPLTAQTLGQMPKPKAKRTLSCWGILLEPHLAVNPSQHFCNVVIPGQKTPCCTGSKQRSSSSVFLHGSHWGLSSALRATLEADKHPVMDLLSCQGCLSYFFIPPCHHCTKMPKPAKI